MNMSRIIPMLPARSVAASIGLLRRAGWVKQEATAKSANARAVELAKALRPSSLRSDRRRFRVSIAARIVPDMKRSSLFLLAFLCIGTLVLAAEEPVFDGELAKRLGADERGMKTYILCILKTGPKDAEIKGDARKEIFAGHFANIGRLADEGKLAVAGPFGKNDKTYRGLYIFNVATIEEAEQLVLLDPAVKAGVFVPELTPWYGSAAMMVVSDTHKRITKPKD